MSDDDQRFGERAALAATATAVLLMAATSVAAPSVPFAPLALAQGLVRIVPGGIATFFIELLGHLALPLAAAGVGVGFLLAGKTLGRLVPWLRRVTGAGHAAATTLALSPLWAASVGLYPADSVAVSLEVFALVTAGAVIAGGFVGGSVVASASTADGSAIADGATTAGGPPDPSRRRAFGWLALGVLGMLAGGAGSLLRRRPDPGERLLDLGRLRRASLPAGGDPEFASVAGLTPRITSIPNFYVVDEALFDPDIEPLTWRLEVSGLVDRPLSLSYEQLSAMPAVERYQTLECISNDVGGDLISTARWAGVPLAHVLDLAGVRSGAVEVAFRSADGYSESHPIEATKDPTTLLALGMNGHVLPRSHGFPARLLTVGTYGMKNPKWLMSMEVLDRPYEGFWERRGWSKTAMVKTGARIDTPVAAVAGRATDVAGVAFAGDRGVASVEVSIDNGPWRAALLETAASAFTWVRWRLPWTPQRPGIALLRSRAVDGTGVRQPADVTDPHPDGASGYHAIRVEVSE